MQRNTHTKQINDNYWVPADRYLLQCIMYSVCTVQCTVTCKLVSNEIKTNVKRMRIAKIWKCRFHFSTICEINECGQSILIKYLSQTTRERTSSTISQIPWQCNFVITQEGKGVDGIWLYDSASITCPINQTLSKWQKHQLERNQPKKNRPKSKKLSMNYTTNIHTDLLRYHYRDSIHTKILHVHCSLFSVCSVHTMCTGSFAWEIACSSSIQHTHGHVYADFYTRRSIAIIVVLKVGFKSWKKGFMWLIHLHLLNIFFSPFLGFSLQ